jgi:hypothetical protein
MKIKVEKYKYTKVLEEDFEIEMPDKPTYLFQYGVRTSHAIIPEWTTWEHQYDKPEHIFQYRIISVDSQWDSNSYIKHETIQVHSIPELYNRKEPNALSRLIQNVILGIASNEVRTKEDFMVDYNKVLGLCNESIK